MLTDAGLSNARLVVPVVGLLVVVLPVVGLFVNDECTLYNWCTWCVQCIELRCNEPLPKSGYCWVEYGTISDT